MSAPSLRRQLLLWLLLPLLGLLALDAWLTYGRAMAAAHRAFDRTLQASLKAMRDGIRLRDGQFAIDLPYLALEMFESEAGSSIFYRILDARGHTLTGYDELPLPPTWPPEPYRTAFYDTALRGMQVRVAAQLLPVRDAASAQIRTVWILVGESVEPREALAHDMLTGSLLQEGLLVLLALGIVWLGVRRGLRPLRRLSASVAARNADALAPLPQHGLPAEVTPLVAAINQYVARLLRMLDARKRFFADAAHQLKTPLAVIQAQSELALREPDGERIRRHLAPLHDTVRQAAKGVQQLLSLSRLEPDSGYAPSLQPLRLDTLAGEVALELAPVARRAGIDLGFEGEPVTVAAEPQWLQELVGNLLDNAIRYAGHDARVTLRVGPLTAPGQDASALLQVEDNGPGIAAEERTAVFGRFYRGAAAQAHQEGSGLGLAIVREIARVHGATVTLSDTAGGGLTVSVRFAQSGDTPVD
ncbi:sensor histidine kinase [Ralstonia solanacearum P673]|uniref:sensor histidine kinase n=1 Tax=Ralstonia solanacearum TaxID=305 RepID=UPI0004471FA1|nr:sensor histidine kinase [Ralstonia solanacearum]EUJ14902.1 sensor histidine kinase [Ralstonia solanacearum P673]MCL9848233.1 sensor histidine kinase N-terminal domain-containing protein [Ralstonia solanacearum]MCL9855037.1 sensor histidine kinase N-terminal domain-containing protein [Ralstonia solanacearum]MCL9858630.1 sensor histidine kinase N-terminal domain-containing protein [Ralstonia solanacearum]MCL9863245.1 sensor histidine kinase N-terminal domain-containing protein [Ralstonia sola